MSENTALNLEKLSCSNLNYEDACQMSIRMVKAGFSVAKERVTYPGPIDGVTHVFTAICPLSGNILAIF